ncbi:MAG: nucleotidyltransferase family protein [Candidatus Schekmanbacteria bacterium]|nr:MAG: nucleotidyltransferase family protein [Candidatus Schekmanbacteria bacterium]
MKALILAGGRGNRINEFSENQNKCMIPFMGKPLIEHNLDQVIIPEISEIIIVVGYRAEDIINYYGTAFKNKRIKYVIQREQKGLVHALECATEALEKDDFCLLLGDEVMVDSNLGEMVRMFLNDNNVFGICGILNVDNLDLIKKTYALVMDGDNRIFRLIEKPKRAINDLQGTGHCVFRNKLLDYIENTPIHHERKEKELPDLIQCAIDDGMVVKAFNVCKKYINVNSYEDLLLAEKYLKNT